MDLLAISYNKLWHILVDKDMSKEKLRVSAGISTTSMAKLRRGESVSTAVLEKVCEALGCTIPDIMDHTNG